MTIRNVPEAVRDELAARAARRGQSLQEFLVSQLSELAARPTPEDVLARARHRLAQAGKPIPVREILKASAADRR